MSGDWDDFVTASKNGTFLFKRPYMDYHADRFRDHSLVVRDEKGEWTAVLPANEQDDCFASHSGLTYGGVVVGDRMTTPAMLEVFQALGAYVAAAGFSRLRYKTVPHIYHSRPAEEDRYALFRMGARLTRRDVLSVLCPRERPAYQERRVRRMKKAAKTGITVDEGRDFGPFWEILSENLARVHDGKPVHSLAEIELLASRFPANIRLHVARDGGAVIAGVVVYDTGRVAHVQYIGSDDRAREVGALDLLFSSLIEGTYAERPYFDFGISNEDDGQVLNVGLVEQKEGFGGRAVVHDYYELEAR